MSLLKYFKKSPAPPKKIKREEVIEYVIGDVIWAKLPDFPWWPGMVCKEPKSGMIFNKLKDKVHVQFFGDPPTRDWVYRRFVIFSFYLSFEPLKMLTKCPRDNNHCCYCNMG